MAEINKKRLDAAFTLGFIGKNLNSKQELCLHSSINTANDILRLISKSGDNGQTIEQISKYLKIHINTVKIYCRWLRSKKLIEAERYGHGGVIVYFAVNDY